MTAGDGLLMTMAKLLERNISDGLWSFGQFWLFFELAAKNVNLKVPDNVSYMQAGDCDSRCVMTEPSKSDCLHHLHAGNYESGHSEGQR